MPEDSNPGYQGDQDMPTPVGRFVDREHSVVETVLAAQEKEISVLAELIGELRSRLTPVSVSVERNETEGPDPDVQKQRSGSSPMYSCVERNTQGIRMLQEIIRSTTRALEI